MSSSPTARTTLLVLVVALVLGASACTPATPPRFAAQGPTDAALAPVAVSDSDFAGYTYRILLDPERSPDRMNILAGVVQKQLKRAAQRFEAGGDEVGLRALIGAFLLLRSGEARPEMFRTEPGALRQGASEVARLGYDGQAVALYSLVQKELPAGPERADVDAHIAAIQAFARATRGDSALQTAGADARSAAQKSLLDARPDVVSQAHERVATWIHRAIDSDRREHVTSASAERDANEIFRAVRGGAISLIAIYLRHGDPGAALAALSGGELERLVPRELGELLENAAERADPNAWEELYRFYSAQAEGGDSRELLDSELMAGAAWGAAVELFRSEPGSLRGAMPLAVELVKHGMAEVATVVLASAVGPGSPREHVGAVLAVTSNSVVAEDAAGQLEAARRTFGGAEDVLELAETREFARRVAPSAARVRYVMAAVETRHAELERALPLLQRAIAAEPSTDALTMLGSLERQRRNVDAALAAFDRVIKLAKTGGEALAEIDALNQRFETLRDAGRPETEAALQRALERALDAQRQGRPGPSQARAERLLARILEHYGDAPGIRRAEDRAYEAAGGDARQLGATILDISRRALSRSNLQAARLATLRAIEANLPADEIVYVALWLQLLELKLKVASDGTVEDAYAKIDEASGWPAKLRSWGRGKLSDDELAAAARGPAQRTEAKFYAAMRQHASGKDATAALREVAASAAIDLMEVGMARDLTAAPTRYALPANTVLP